MRRPAAAERARRAARKGSGPPERADHLVEGAVGAFTTVQVEFGLGLIHLDGHGGGIIGGGRRQGIPRRGVEADEGGELIGRADGKKIVRRETIQKIESSFFIIAS